MELDKRHSTIIKYFGSIYTKFGEFWETIDRKKVIREIAYSEDAFTF